MLGVNKLDGIYYLFAKNSSVNENALSFFYALSDGQPHSQKDICDSWLIPRTTINTIVKTAMTNGYICFSPKVRNKEKFLLLTPKGQKYADELLTSVFAAENKAMTETLTAFSPDFVGAIEKFGDCLQRELDFFSHR